MNTLAVPICFLDNFPAEKKADLRQARVGDAGVDLISCEDVELKRDGQQVVISTGIKVAIPMGHVGMVCTRSGLAAKHGVQVVNAPGIIDSGYRGEIKVIMNISNHVSNPFGMFIIHRGDRIAQLLVIPIPAINFDQYTTSAFEQEFGNTERGTGGLGSTGK